MLNTKPFEFQVQDVRALRRWDYCGIAGWDMGLGKSLLSLMCVDRLPAAKPVVIVCPAIVKWNWQAEAVKHIATHPMVLETTRPPDHLPNQPIYIVNYDILGQRRGDNYGPGWLKVLKGKKPQIIILDESQQIGYNSKRFRWLKELCTDIPHRIALTGTPFNNRPADLWPTLNLIRPDIFTNYYQFGHKFCGPKRNPFSGSWDFKGATNIAELHKLLTSTCLIRRRKIDVMSDLPEKIRSVVPVDMDRPQEYRKAVREFRRWLMEKKPSAAGTSWRAEALVKVGYLRRLAAELKLPAIYAWIDDFLKTGSKLIVFGVHKAVLQPIFQKYKRLAVLVDGSVTGNHRQAAIDRFNSSPSCRLFDGNIRAAGTGWSARACSTTLFVELDWTPTAMAQAGDRTHGIGRGRGTESSLDVYLIARNSIEEKVLGLLDVKQKNIDRIIDGADAEEDSIFNQLLDDFRQDSDLLGE